METIMRHYKFYIDRKKQQYAAKQAKKQQRQQQQQQGDKQKEKNDKIPTSVEWKDGHRDGRELIRKLYKSNKRNATKTMEEIETLMKKYSGDIKKVADELKNRFGA